MKLAQKLCWIFLLAGGALISSCKEKKNDPITYPPVTLYPVKESKTYIFENGNVVDSMIFRLTFDNQDRLLSQWSVKENLIVEIDYSQPSKVIMYQKVKSEDTVNFKFEYLLNSVGAASIKNTFGAHGTKLQTHSYVYNSEGHKMKEYMRAAADSSLVYYGTWEGVNLTHYEYPSSEFLVDIKYTDIPDNRNLGFFHFQKDRSYHLIQKEIVKTRGSIKTNEYSYQFDSKNRPVEVITTQNGVKLFEKHYQYW